MNNVLPTVSKIIATSLRNIYAHQVNNKLTVLANVVAPISSDYNKFMPLVASAIKSKCYY